MTRIGSYAQHQQFVSRLLDIQTRVQKEQEQVTTQKKTTVYAGLNTGEVNLSIVYENERTMQSAYKANNTIAAERLSEASTAINSIRTSLVDFRNALRNFSDTNPKDEGKVKQIQDYAYRTLIDIQTSLNTNVNGQYLFSGGRVNTVPVDLATGSLTDFQTRYDGITSTFPASRQLALQDLQVNATDTGAVTFDPNSGAIVASTIDGYAKVPTGSNVTVSGTTNNNADYTVRAHAATNSLGAVLGEGSDPDAYITANGANITSATTGGLSFNFNTSGQIVAKATNPGTLSSLTAGTKFTIAGSVGGAYDGAFTVTSYNAVTDEVTLANDAGLATAESVNVASVSLQTAVAPSTIPDTAVDLSARTGTAAFSATGRSVTMTLPTGAPGLDSIYLPGSPITIAGTNGHNGTYTVQSVTPDSVTFDVNPDAVRVSQFVPQTNRADVQLSFLDSTTKHTSTFSATTNATYFDTAEGIDTTIPGTPYGTLSFSTTATGGEMITASNGNSFALANGTPYPPVGAMITLKSTSGVNDGVYEVVSNDKTNIVVRSRPLTAETTSTAAMGATGWYKGDNIVVQQQVDASRTLDVGIYASDPAMEKALRGVATIAQGVFGTAGGLENHLERVGEAMKLIQDAIQSQGKLPNESAGDLQTLQSNIGFTQARIKLAQDAQGARVSFLQTRLADIQGISPTEAITNLLADNNALQASYQTMAQLRKNSLLDFLR